MYMGDILFDWYTEKGAGVLNAGSPVENAYRLLFSYAGFFLLLVWIQLDSYSVLIWERQYSFYAFAHTSHLVLFCYAMHLQSRTAIDNFILLAGWNKFTKHTQTPRQREYVCVCVSAQRVQSLLICLTSVCENIAFSSVSWNTYSHTHKTNGRDENEKKRWKMELNHSENLTYYECIELNAWNIQAESSVFFSFSQTTFLFSLFCSIWMCVCVRVCGRKLG